jgi:D-alanyl-D-alanine carboxypeptidase-like protein
MTRRLTHLTILGLLCCLPLLAGFSLSLPIPVPKLAVPALHSDQPVNPAPASSGTITFVASAPANPATDQTAEPAAARPTSAPASDELADAAHPESSEPTTGFGGGLPAPSPADPVQPPAAPPVQGPPLPAATAVPVALPVQERKPPAPLPNTTWVQAFKPTVLWDSDKPQATSLGGLPQWTSFRLTGPSGGKRLSVEYPGDGLASLPMRGWVDASDVGPAGRPNPDWQLSAGGEVNPLTGITAPKRTVQAWPQGISAQFAALVDGDSGQLLWGHNANGQVAPASLTKIITSLVALDKTQLSDRVTVNVDSRTMWESTVMGLTPGENLSMETLLFGLMLPSGNDAALAIARAVAGSDAAFVELMNAKASELKLANSHFANPHGLDADGHYSSPYDLCIFARDGMRNPTFQRLASTRQYTGEGYNLYNLNRLLGLYAKADGVKVGYTDAAGRAIVASATQDGHRVYATLIRSANPVPEAQALLEWAFNGYTWP